MFEAAFRLYEWQDEEEAAEALGSTPERVRAWRRGSERMEVADFMALTATVNVGLAESMRTGKASGLNLAGVAEALGVSPESTETAGSPT